ncbi:hypothetical protein NP233_g10850 [Leucocoprinus birnbaumii]|uniref:Uncharacterized protein n=1 Tax=Leucocoprinus birnbaumii TaxID=56174 RepID=A0AAD5VL90_9AGAR|nr:hypothetical protein NP233_g10850 [Leucocoprinus birnbaumii]
MPQLRRVGEDGKTIKQLDQEAKVHKEEEKAVRAHALRALEQENLSRIATASLTPVAPCNNLNVFGQSQDRHSANAGYSESIPELDLCATGLVSLIHKEQIGPDKQVELPLVQATGKKHQCNTQDTSTYVYMRSPEKKCGLAHNSMPQHKDKERLACDNAVMGKARSTLPVEPRAVDNGHLGSNVKPKWTGIRAIKMIAIDDKDQVEAQEEMDVEYEGEIQIEIQGEDDEEVIDVQEEELDDVEMRDERFQLEEADSDDVDTIRETAEHHKDEDDAEEDKNAEEGKNADEDNHEEEGNDAEVEGNDAEEDVEGKGDEEDVADVESTEDKEDQEYEDKEEEDKNKEDANEERDPKYGEEYIDSKSEDDFVTQNKKSGQGKLARNGRMKQDPKHHMQTSNWTYPCLYPSSLLILETGPNNSVTPEKDGTSEHWSLMDQGPSLGAATQHSPIMQADVVVSKDPQNQLQQQSAPQKCGRKPAVKRMASTTLDWNLPTMQPGLSSVLQVQEDGVSAKLMANVIAFDNPLEELQTKLPLSHEELSEVLTFVFMGSAQPTPAEL